MSRHWKPGPPSEWTVIDGYASGARARGGIVPVVLSAVVIGLAAGGILSWTARHADSEPSAEIEWNAVQAVPRRAPDAEDVAWQQRAQPEPSPSWGGLGGGEQRVPSAADAPGPPPCTRSACPGDLRIPVPQTGLPRASPTRGEANNRLYVIDGDTFSMGGQRVRIAGIDAPETHPPRCMEEARLGLAATQKLRELLGSGTVTMSGTGHDQYGRELRSVQVNGQDVGEAMISGGVAREYGSGRRPWC